MDIRRGLLWFICFGINFLSSSSHPVVVNLTKQGLADIPTNIRIDVTNLDLSYNRIKRIYTTSLQTYTRLEKLFLQCNQIDIVEEGSFRALGSLTMINLSGNKMDLLNNSALLFEGLENLTYLDLRYNLNFQSENIRYYTDKAFAILSSLTFLGLDLDNNPVFGEGFRNLTNLETLSFENCYIDTLRNKTFHNFPQSVSSLSITNCKTHFVDVEAGALLPFPRLMSLDLSRSRLHLIQALMMIKPFRNRNFTTLNFYGLNCPLYNSDRYPYTLTIKPEMTKHLQTMCIENLNIGDNGIAEIRPNSLLKMHHPECLKSLILRENRFFIEYGAILSEVQEFLKNCTNLKMLDWSFQLGRYNPGFVQTKDNHPGLQSRSLYNQQIGYFGRKLTSYNVQSSENYTLHGNISQLSFRPFHHQIDVENDSFLPRLLYSQNPIIFMPDSLEILLVNNIITYDYLKAIYFQEGSNLKYIDVSFAHANDFLFLINPKARLKLQTIVVDGTPYKSLVIIQAGFKNNSILELVWRNSNLQDMVLTLQKRDSKYKKRILTFLDKLKSLVKLDVSHNNLYQWDKQIFVHINQLTKLDFSYNSFQYMPEGIQSLEQLQELDLRHNRLTTVEERVRTWADTRNERNNFSLYLADNAFKCDCSNLDFITWLKKTKVKLDREAYLCTLQNGSLIDTSLAYKEMHKLFKDCSANFWLTASIASLCCFIIVSLLFLLYNRRWNITLYFYKKFQFLLRRKYQRTFLYDVYVSYDSESLGWIKDTLIPKLENTWKLKLCLRDRDSLPGRSIFDSETSNIEISRHALFVIGKTFKTECERLFEVEQVKYEKLVKNIENIIIIAKDVKVSELPVELAILWRYISFISWSENDRDLDVIWKKLQIWTCDALSYETTR